ncbi:MAG: SRPBCC family protein [Spirochaetaceae bacterium]|nr:MAG: SRPBCC family protein [Spirochaetaceae bacterium]
MNSKAKIKWRKSERFERMKKFELAFPPKKIFPLLCPVLEYEWLPGWKCVMCYSESGVAEKNAIFHTRENLGLRVVWTLITYEPDRFVEYIMVSGKDAVVRLSVSLEENKSGNTQVTWRMLFTLTSGISRHAIPRAFSPGNYERFVEQKQRELDRYLRTGKMMGK